MLMFANPQKLYRLSWVRQSPLNLAGTGLLTAFQSTLNEQLCEVIRLLINILVLTSGHKVKLYFPTALASAKKRSAEVMCVVLGESTPLSFSYLSDCRSTRQDR